MCRAPVGAAWMAGSSPAMTAQGLHRPASDSRKMAVLLATEGCPWASTGFLETLADVMAGLDPAIHAGAEGASRPHPFNAMSRIVVHDVRRRDPQRPLSVDSRRSTARDSIGEAPIPAKGRAMRRPPAAIPRTVSIA